MDKKSDVVIVKTEQYEYPDCNTFRPSVAYPEYLFAEEVAAGKNEVYDMVRQGFRLMGFDLEHYGTPDWNPLKELIKPGNVVVIKPNLVMDVNHAVGGGTECLYTHPSVVAPVIDYILIALQGEGEVIVGDAPMQSCDFERLIHESHYKELIGFYQTRTSVRVSLVDFRDLHSMNKDGIIYYEISDKSSGLVVDIGQESEFVDEDDYFYENMRITSYDPAILKLHHNREKNEYLINENILRADVIINMPKPKTHRKAGVTISMKNLVGINARKEYLPHHTNGSLKDGGDEYLHGSMFKKAADRLTDRYNYYVQTIKGYRRARAILILRRFVNLMVRLTQKDDYREGSWYGNDTISRTIVDLNRILFYADKHGKLCKDKQRRYLIIADMIVSGEKEGPVAPSPKKVGMIAFGTNPVCFDEAIATIMGAKLERIPTINRARESKTIHKLVEEGEFAWLISNDKRWDGKKLTDLKDDSILYFEPTSGWKEAFYDNLMKDGE